MRAQRLLFSQPKEPRNHPTHFFLFDLVVEDVLHADDPADDPRAGEVVHGEDGAALVLVSDEAEALGLAWKGGFGGVRHEGEKAKGGRGVTPRMDRGTPRQREVPAASQRTRLLVTDEGDVDYLAILRNREDDCGLKTRGQVVECLNAVL